MPSPNWVSPADRNIYGGINRIYNVLNDHQISIEGNKPLKIFSSFLSMNEIVKWAPCIIVGTRQFISLKHFQSPHYLQRLQDDNALLQVWCNRAFLMLITNINKMDEDPLISTMADV